MNEETIIDNTSRKNNLNVQNESKKEGGTWKHVTLGGVTGILMGAGLVYSGNAFAASDTETPKPEDAETKPEDTTETQTEETTDTQSVPTATVNEGLSFSEAFNAARTAVGPGGVFEWHGGLYNTYTADEWNAMTDAQKDEFAQLVKPITPANLVQTPTDANTYVVVVHDVQNAPEPAQDNDVQVVAADGQNTDTNDDVHIVGYTEADGHLVVGIDTTNDGQADVAIIDIDDSGNASAPDIVMDRNGNMATIGDLTGETASNQMASLQNPDVASDMPDYMNDATIDA